MRRDLCLHAVGGGAGGGATLSCSDKQPMESAPASHLPSYRLSLTHSLSRAVIGLSAADTMVVPSLGPRGIPQGLRVSCSPRALATLTGHTIKFLHHTCTLVLHLSFQFMFAEHLSTRLCAETACVCTLPVSHSWEVLVVTSAWQVWELRPGRPPLWTYPTSSSDLLCYIQASAAASGDKGGP